MLTLNVLQGARRRVELDLGAAKVEAAPLSFPDEELIEELEPMPRVPVRQPAHKGSLAEPEPDPHDPEYVAARTRRFGRVALLTVAAACDYQPEGGEPWSRAKAAPPSRRAWAAATLAQWGETLTEAIVLRAHAELARASSLADLAREAAKN